MPTSATSGTDTTGCDGGGPFPASADERLMAA